eukprot:IDg23527t1
MALNKSKLTACLLFFLCVARSMASLILYRNSNFRGTRLTFTTSVARMSQFRFNDQASSMVITSGRWRIYEDANFRGRSALRGPGRYSNSGAMGIGNDRLSSIRRV